MFRSSRRYRVIAPDLVAAAAEVAGRRRMEQAISQLGPPLKYAEEEVHTGRARAEV